MALTSGFFDSVNHDRRYNSRQFSSIFDGVIEDGVYQKIGDAFFVSATTGLKINIGTGRAWFNHTWTSNDSILSIQAPQTDVLLDRIDAVILEVNSREVVRANSIKIKQGVPSTEPKRPTMVHEIDFNEYAIAYILRPANSSNISQSQITYVVGTEETPYVIGAVKSVSIDNLISQWSSQWKDWLNTNKQSFESWYSELRNIMSGDTAGNIMSKLTVLTQLFNTGMSDLSNRVDALERATTIETKIVTLTKTNWNSNKVYTISDSLITATSIQSILPVQLNNPPTTQEIEYMKTLAKMNLAVVGQGTGYINICCLGTLPTGDINIQVIFEK